MEDNKNTPQPSQESSGIIELFAPMVILQFMGGMQWDNTGRDLLLDVLKSDDDGKIKELAAKLNTGEGHIRRGIKSIRNLLKEQAKKNGMSVEELMDVVM